MKPTSALHLLVALAITAPLAGCDDIDDFFRVWSGQPSKAQARHEAAQARLIVGHAEPLLPDAQPILPGEPPVQAAETAPVIVPEPEPIDPGPPPFECVTIWRTQTCDEGVLYMLDSNGNWILPGRTE